MLATAAVVLVAVGLVAALCSWSIARSEAREEARDSATRLADYMVGPLLGRALAGDVRAEDELRQALRNRMSDGSVSQVTAWTDEGVVVFSSEPRLLGRRIVDNTELTDAAAGHPSAQISAADDFSTLPGGREFVEVYVPMRSVPGLVLEVYYDAAVVRSRAMALLPPILAVAVLPLLLLQALQLPAVLSMVRRLRGAARERAELLERSLTASERERREIASGLHDTVVQDLAGAGYALAAARRTVPAEGRTLMDPAVETVHGAVAALRGLMVELYPPDLTGSGLPSAVDTLCLPLRRRGVDVTVSLGLATPVDPEVVPTLYRILRECLTNVGKHAGASRVHVAVQSSEQGVRLAVVDDGVGLAPDADDRPGHFGMRLIDDRVNELGGRWRVSPRLGGGTVVDVDLPAPGFDPSPVDGADLDGLAALDGTIDPAAVGTKVPVG